MWLKALLAPAVDVFGARLLGIELTPPHPFKRPAAQHSRRASTRQRLQRVDCRDVEGREMAHVPGENRKVMDTRRRRDGEVGKAE